MSRSVSMYDRDITCDICGCDLTQNHELEQGLCETCQAEIVDLLPGG